jgi:hypothetical protein
MPVPAPPNRGRLMAVGRSGPEALLLLLDQAEAIECEQQKSKTGMAYAEGLRRRAHTSTLPKVLFSSHI